MATDWLLIETFGGHRAGNDDRPDETAIAQRLVDDADHHEQLVADEQSGLEIEAVDPQFGRKVGTDDRHRVGTRNMTVVEPAARSDVPAYGAEHAARRSHDR